MIIAIKTSLYSTPNYRTSMHAHYVTGVDISGADDVGSSVMSRFICGWDWHAQRTPGRAAAGGGRRLHRAWPRASDRARGPSCITMFEFYTEDTRGEELSPMAFRMIISDHSVIIRYSQTHVR